MIVQGHVGPASVGDGVDLDVRLGRQGDQIVSELHSRFYEQAFRSNIFMGGMALTAINNATFTSATTGVTATPLIGLWNPLSSGVNGVLLQAQLGVTMTALQATGGGPYVWMASTGNNAITTGAIPYSTKTLTTTGSLLKNLSGAACTGMTGTLTFMRGSSLGGGSASNAAFLATAASMQSVFNAFVENIDGSIIVPPGGVIALMATTTPVAHSAVSGLIWEEVPVAL